MSSLINFGKSDSNLIVDGKFSATNFISEIILSEVILISFGILKSDTSVILSGILKDSILIKAGMSCNIFISGITGAITFIIDGIPISLISTLKEGSSRSFIPSIDL